MQVILASESASPPYPALVVTSLIGMEAVYQEYKDKGVVVIGVDIREAEEEVRQYVQQGGYSWTFVLDTTGGVAASYRIAAIPTSFFIDREGVIQAVNIGAMTKRVMETKLAEAMR